MWYNNRNNKKSDKSTWVKNDLKQFRLLDLVNDQHFTELIADFALVLQGTQSREGPITTDRPDRGVIGKNGKAWIHRGESDPDPDPC